MSVRITVGVACGLLTLCLLACGMLPDMSPDPSSGINPTRRIYVNDSAANDSLARALFNGGAYFWVQPGQTYALHVRLSTAGDRLAIYAGGDYGWASWKTLDANQGNGEEVFNFQSNFTKATLLAANFIPVDTTALTKLKSGSVHPWVHLQGVSEESHSIKVHLIMVGSFSSLPEFPASPSDATSKASFAKALLNDLGTLLSSYGIALDTTSSFEIVKPEIAPVTVAYESSDTALPGDRISGCVHLYLVNDISAKNLQPGQKIIGFAPREVRDLDRSNNSRVVLSANGTSSIMDMARTTAHEMGHFFGLRHVWATTADLANEADSSNLDDGLPSTGKCTTKFLSKQSGAFTTSEVSLGDGGYCLRIAGTAFDCGSNSCEPKAIRNLMFAFACPNQDSLTSEQQIIERKNMMMLGAK